MPQDNMNTRTHVYTGTQPDKKMKPKSEDYIYTLSLAQAEDVLQATNICPLQTHTKFISRANKQSGVFLAVLRYFKALQSPYRLTSCACLGKCSIPTPLSLKEINT